VVAEQEVVAEEEVNENMPSTITHANARKTGAENNTNYGKEERLRDALKEGKETKISSLINENKGLTKKLNETKKYKQSVTTLVEQYKSALEKYRNQLKEMATFNTNLAHVNNLLVNESFALTQEEASQSGSILAAISFINSIIIFCFFRRINNTDY